MKLSRTSITSPQVISPRPPSSDFSIDLPSTIVPDGIEDVKDIHEHHKHVFDAEDAEIQAASAGSGAKLIERRRLDLEQAEKLFAVYREKAPFFPFVVIPPDATVRLLSRKSPFLLLAILTSAACMDPPLRCQLDQELRRVLSAKVIIDGRKSLDYLQGLLVYIAWYPIHSNPKNIQALMYVNVAVSLAIELGLNNDSPNSALFYSCKQEGVVMNGSFTQAARRAYLGAYYVSAALSMGFQKPNVLEFRNLMDANGECLLMNEDQEDVVALITLQRLAERIALFHRHKVIDPNDPDFILTAEVNVQMFQSELDRYRHDTREQIRNLTNVALAEQFVALCIYSHELGLLRKPYRDHVTDIAATASQNHLSGCLIACKRFFEYLLSVPEKSYLNFGTLQWGLMIQATLVLSRLTFLMATTRSWDAETARSNCPLVMYLDALCYRFQSLSNARQGTGTPRTPDPIYMFKMVLNSVKKSYEKRVANIKPEASTVDRRGHCPMLDSSLQQYFSNNAGIGRHGENWDFGSVPDMSTPDLSGTDWSASPQSEAMANIDFSGLDMSALQYNDLWATMTNNWAGSNTGVDNIENFGGHTV